MAKKFTRTMTKIKDIVMLPFFTNNVGDILSNDKDMYIHSKDGLVHEYHCLTDNIKTINSANNLANVINDNNNNTSTIIVNHDDSKQDVLIAGDNIKIIDNVISSTSQPQNFNVRTGVIRVYLTGEAFDMFGQDISDTIDEDKKEFINSFKNKVLSFKYLHIFDKYFIPHTYEDKNGYLIGINNVYFQDDEEKYVIDYDGYHLGYRNVDISS